jgi:hypothetical protein
MKKETYENMKPEEKAYNQGFRVSLAGALYNLNGREYSSQNKSGKTYFSIRRYGKTQTIYIARLQAFQKFGTKLYNFRLIRHLNLNSQDCSIDNIELGKGSEIINEALLNMQKAERAYHLGYGVDDCGALLYNGFDVEEKIFNNKFGYKLFSIPFKEHNMSQVFVHRLQAFQKFGNEVYTSDCVRHLNGNCQDNSKDNIALGTHLDNYKDMSDEVKKRANDKRSKYYKYPIAMRRRLRQRFENGEIIHHISLDTGIAWNIVANICKRRSIIDKLK